MDGDPTSSKWAGNAFRGPSPGALGAILAFLGFACFFSFGAPASATDHDLCLDGAIAPELAGADFLRSYRPGLHAPSRMALTSADVLIVSDPARNRLIARAPDGRVLWRQPFPTQPSAIAVDDQGGRPFTFYVGETSTGRVAAYAADWTPLRELGAGAGEFESVNDIAVDPQTGTVYVADSEAGMVRIFARDGAPLGGFDGKGNAEGAFAFPAAIAVDPWRDELLVTDQLNYRIQIFDLDGNFVCRLGDAAGSSPGSIFGLRSRLFSVPQGLAVDSEGRIFVADSAEGRIRVVDRSGAILGEIGGFGEGADRLRVPLDLAIDSDNRLFVSDSNNSRLAVYGLETYADPEAFAPAAGVMTPNPFDHRGFDERFTAIVEIPGYPLSEVVAASITANGTPAEGGIAEIGDADGDLEPDLLVSFARDALAPTLLAEGVVPIVLRGQMAALDFDATVYLTVIGGVVDDDGDGILDDVDLCLDTPPGGVIDADGCAISQLCPCDATFGGAPWAARGEFVSCTEGAARRFANAGLIGRAEIGGVISAAVRAECPGDG